mgnify:CR=1 FL=1
MENTNINWIAMSDSAIVNKIGAFIKNERLSRNKTQAQLATAAGINKWTISQIENGEAITLLSLIQILRALDVLPLLDIFSIKQENRCNLVAHFNYNMRLNIWIFNENFLCS